jgi:hypothetical protein
VRTVAAVCIAFLVLVGTAEARTVTISSAVSIKASDLTFSGRVTSPNSACRDARRVTLYERLSSGGSRKIGGYTTGPSGKWRVTVSGFAGVSMEHFFAKVKQRSEGAAGTTYVCRAARSATILP